MNCPEACRECGSFHAEYLICGSRDRKRKGSEEWLTEESTKRVRLAGYTEKRVPKKVRDEWVPLLVDSHKSQKSIG